MARVRNGYKYLDKGIVQDSTQIEFLCPGCKAIHVLNIADNHRGPKVHNFDGDYDNPTITPSIVNKKVRPDLVICHAFISNGFIKFEEDCTHELKGQNIELTEIEPSPYKKEDEA